jgi:ABC-type lipoprotein release transport system permease subunit
MALPLAYNVRNVRVRWQVTLLAVLGIALVVAVFVVLAAMASGFRQVLAGTGTVANGVVVQRGSTSELTSAVSRDNVSLLSVDDRVARDAQGRALASPEHVIVFNAPKVGGGETNVLIRGVTPMAFDVRQGVRLVEGRAFTPGLYEAIVGTRIVDRVEGLTVGSTVKIQRRDWTIVGLFESGGSGFESEVWADADALGPLFNRRGGYSSLTVRLVDPAMVESFDRDIRRNPQMQLQMKDERAYYADQTGLVGQAMWGLAVFVSIIMSIGAVFGAMNTMYAIVSARTREVGTLRALGFSRSGVLTTFVIESVLLATVGGVLGCLMALPANGLTGGTANATFSELAFAFRITPAALTVGMIFAIVMGVAGGLLPAFRAARMPIVSALREV